MKLCEETKSIGKLISILYRHSKIYFQRELGQYNLGHGQVPVLMYIIHEGKVTQHQINDHFQLDKGSTSTLIKNLEKNGFINRVQDESDKRAYWLFATDKTVKLIPELKHIFKEWTDILVHGFREEEKEQAFLLLNRMIDNSNHYLDKKEER